MTKKIALSCCFALLFIWASVGAIKADAAVGVHSSFDSDYAH